MAHVKIEICRNGIWTVRQEGEIEVTAEALVALLPSYAIQYAHRAYLDGLMVGEIAAPKCGRKS
ncbi:MAG: hypothetical protein JWP29_1998 [Rhodoferax sp.]|nr:hypothetical protein [Rhodoferax sp.]